MMGCFAHDEGLSNTRRLLPSFMKEACCHCHLPCFKIPSSLESEDAETIADSDILDNRHVILLEIRSRAMRAKTKSREYLFAGSLRWVVSPTTGKLLIAPKEEEEEEKESGGGDGYDDGGGDDCGSNYSEAFYSVRSCFSRCSSGTGASRRHRGGGGSIWEELCECEGWPFGLCRKALMLPPLPASPSDSWTWSKKSLNNNSKLYAAA